jgi:very-long-chain enoyl-CoA reductase
MELTIVNEVSKKNKNETHKIILELSNTVDELKKQITILGIKLSEERMGLYYVNSKMEKIYLTSGMKALGDFNVADKTEIHVKDLGPQINWRLVYLAEYSGPIFIILGYFLLLGPQKANNTQIAGFIMSTFHYCKRFFESIFVHHFSNSTMPLSNLWTNIIYYWFLYATMCGYFLINPNYNEPKWNLFLRGALVFFFFCCELKNLKCHLIQKELKEKLKGEKGIPKGAGYDLVSCANYFWEFMSWVFFSLFVNHWSFYVFTLCGFLIMRNWALKKHRDYHKKFPDYPKKRKAFIPYLI